MHKPNKITKNYKYLKPPLKISLLVVVVVDVEIIPIRTPIIIPTHLPQQQPKEEKLPCTESGTSIVIHVELY